MKKLLLIILCLVFCALNFTACGESNSENEKILRICNCEDYIDEELLTEFEELTGCTIEYSTFGTLENLYNDIKITPDRYDLICPSDYMIEKMAKEGILQKINFAEDGNYKTYVSPYIDNTFENITWNDGADSLADYAACYMWGTLGLTFNPEYVTGEDMDSWASLWDAKYKNQSTIKDSIRDSYFMGVAYANKAELDELASKLEQNQITLEAYQSELKRIFNDTSEQNVERVEIALSELKSNIYGFEVDSGKNDIASGKITINFAWSGDAVYAMDEAETQGVELYYTVPAEGSNVWFDGWCVPASSKQVDLAIEFIEFLSSPEVAVRNMEYIGYTSGTAGQVVFDNAIDWYGACTLVESELTAEDYSALSEEDAEYYELTSDGKVYEYIYVGYEEVSIIGNQEEGYTAKISVYNEETGLIEQEDVEIYAVDLTYFFGEIEGENAVIYTDTIGRQFTAQYPPEEIISRCVVMNCYDEDANGRVTLMWERVKGFTFSTAVLIILLLICLLLIVGVIILKNKSSIFKLNSVSQKESGRRKKYKVIKIEEIDSTSKNDK